MIEPLKGDELVKRFGGSFRLTAAIQRRLKELVEGARPLVDATGRSLIEIAVQELHENKIEIDYEKSENLPKPDRAILEVEVRGGTTARDTGSRMDQTGGLST